jgi:hypothetical protein
MFLLEGQPRKKFLIFSYMHGFETKPTFFLNTSDRKLCISWQQWYRDNNECAIFTCFMVIKVVRSIKDNNNKSRFWNWSADYSARER